MIPISELINKVKWDKRENPAEYIIFYEDRIVNEEKSIPYSAILRIDGNFFVIQGEHGETSIPLHRIREVRKNNETVWELR